MKQLLIITLCLFSMYCFSQSKDDYIDQYVTILNSYCKKYCEKDSDQLCFSYLNDSTDFEDPIMTKRIYDSSKNKKICIDSPQRNSCHLFLRMPRIQDDGSVVFFVPTGTLIKKTNNVEIFGTSIYVFKRKRSRMKLISTIFVGI